MPTTPVESAPWPIPEGTRLDPETWDLLAQMIVAADALQARVVEYVAERPVTRDPSHPVYIHDLAKVLDTLEKVLDSLKASQVHAAEFFCRALPFGTPSVTYGDTRPLIPRFGGQRVNWRNDLLADDVLPLLVMDPESGEKRDSVDVRDLCFSVVSLNGSNVKVTGLRALGLDPDDYCHKVPKAAEVQVVK